MSKKNEAELDLDNLDLEMVEVKTPVQPMDEGIQLSKKVNIKKTDEDSPLISCLRNEKIIARFIPKETGLVTNPKHIFYGGMAETAFRKFTVPVLESSGAFVNVLTNSEKTYLEHIMGLEPNSLSVYLKKDNFWVNYSVRLTKGDNLLDLSVPDDFIKYKVLIANRDFIAPSIFTLQENPKATYQFVLIAETDETKSNKKALNASMQAYMILGKIQEDKEILRFIIETIEGRPFSEKTSIDVLQSKAQKAIQGDAKFFVTIAEDVHLSTKVLIRECVEKALIRKRGDFLYLAEDNSPLCEAGEDPVLNIAANYLDSPKKQQLKLTLEAKLKKAKE